MNFKGIVQQLATERVQRLDASTLRVMCCRFVTSFVTVFATVIAITKDLPDVEGDRKFNIDTLATRLGVRTIAFAGELFRNVVKVWWLSSRRPKCNVCWLGV